MNLCMAVRDSRAMVNCMQLWYGTVMFNVSFLFQVLTMEGYYEIVSLLGTPKNLQISLSHKDGNVTTGHVTGELIVFTTAEIVLGQKSSSE